MGIKGAFLNIIKAINEETAVNIILIRQTLEAFPLRSGTRQGCLLSPLLFSKALEVLATVFRPRRNKRHPNWKGGSKTVIVGNDMIVYIENPTDSTKKLLDLMNWAKQQDTESIFRNQRHFCTPTMKYQKQQSGNKSHLL